jgi:ketol-acid reductoisomerase
MATIYYESDAEPAALAGQRIAVVGYGNQGRSWALNLRDSGCDVHVCVRRDETREQADAEGFETADLAAAGAADVVCLLVPDDAIAGLPLERPAAGLTIVASGYTPAFGRLQVAGDVTMIAPRMLGPEVRACYEEGIGFISAVGVHADVTGAALRRTLAVAHAIGALRQGAIELSPHQEAVLDLAVEQVLSPALTRVQEAFVRTMLEHGIPLEAIMTEQILSGEVERTYRLVREIGYANQMEFHSPTSQYGQLSRRSAYDGLDFTPRMRELTDDIASGRFADEWDAEAGAGYARLRELKERWCGPGVRTLEEAIRRRLGPNATSHRGGV